MSGEEDPPCDAAPPRHNKCYRLQSLLAGFQERDLDVLNNCPKCYPKLKVFETCENEMRPFYNHFMESMIKKNRTRDMSLAVAGFAGWMAYFLLWLQPRLEGVSGTHGEPYSADNMCKAYLQIMVKLAALGWSEPLEASEAEFSDREVFSPSAEYGIMLCESAGCGDEVLSILKKVLACEKISQDGEKRADDACRENLAVSELKKLHIELPKTLTSRVDDMIAGVKSIIDQEDVLSQAMNFFNRFRSSIIMYKRRLLTSNHQDSDSCQVIQRHNISEFEEAEDEILLRNLVKMFNENLKADWTDALECERCKRKLRRKRKLHRLEE